MSVTKQAALIAAAGTLVLSSLGMTMGARFSPAATTTGAPLVGLTMYGSPNYTRNFNPFIPNNLSSATDWIFEPLYIVNPLTGRQTPWLATSYRWTNSDKTLTFTLRKGVKWSNGTPFTAADVVFTFDMLKTNPGMDTNGIWQSLSSVVANSSNSVSFHFKTVNVPDYFYIAQTMIVPKAQWSKVANPQKFTDPHPIGTGPFELSSFRPSEVVLRKNPRYWQASKVHVPQLKFPALTTNTLTDLMLSEGKLDFATIFTPNIQKTFVGINPRTNHYWFAHSAAVSLYMNLTEYPFNHVAFRRAMAYAINKTNIWKRGEYGYETPSNQAILPPSQQGTWVPKALATKYAYPYSPKKAAAALASMGLKKNAHGQIINPKTHKQLTVTIQVPTGWTDWVQDCQIISSELGALGIKVNVYTPSVSTNFSDLNLGHFQMALDGPGIYASPWFDYNQILNSAESAPIGQFAPTNVERYHNPQVDAWLNAYVKTTSVAQQRTLMHKLEQVMFTQVPVVGLVSGANWYEYTTTHYTGWPNPKNPYSLGVDYPGNLLIATHLQPVR